MWLNGDNTAKEPLVYLRTSHPNIPLKFFRVLYGAVFPIGSVRFGAVNRTAPHRMIFASLKTAPHRTAAFSMFENRTEPHRRISKITEPHRRINNISDNRTEPRRRISDF